jgi:hypothetical protein
LVTLRGKDYFLVTFVGGKISFQWKSDSRSGWWIISESRNGRELSEEGGSGGEGGRGECERKGKEERRKGGRERAKPLYLAGWFVAADIGAD